MTRTGGSVGCGDTAVFFAYVFCLKQKPTATAALCMPFYGKYFLCRTRKLVV